MKLSIGCLLSLLLMTGCAEAGWYDRQENDPVEVSAPTEVAVGAPLQLTFKTAVGGCWTVDKVETSVDSQQKVIQIRVTQRQPSRFLGMGPGCPQSISTQEYRATVYPLALGTFTIRGSLGKEYAKVLVK